MSSRKEQKEQARQAREAKEQEMAAKSARSRRLWIIGGVVAVALIAVVVAVVASSSSNKSSGGSATAVNKRYEGIPQSGITLGEPGAKATIIEYADLRCPFCRDFEEESMPTVIDELIKTGKAKLVFRNLTFLDQSSPSGEDSTNAAKYAAAVGLQNKLFQYVNLFYNNQKDETTDYATQSFLEGLAKQIPGVNASTAWDNRENPKVTAQLEAASKSADDNSVNGTPTFFVGSSESSATKVAVDDLSNPQPIIDAVNNLQ